MTEVQVHLHAKDLSVLQGQGVVFFSKPNSVKDKPAKITEKEIHEIFESSIEDKLITGALQEVITFREANLNNFRHVLVVGLGAEAKMDHEVVRQAGNQGRHGVDLLGQRFQADEREQADAHRGGFQGTEDAYSVFQGAGCDHEIAGCEPASDGVQRGLHRAAAGRGGWHREPRIQLLHTEDA